MKNLHAVSPVIATLMLVLVAVGSAGAFYMWQTGWQGDVEDKAGGADLHSTLRIAGSTTVYKFTAVATELFEAEYPNYKIHFEGGGSGAGVQATGTGAVDIGSCSRAVDTAEYNAYPDLDVDGNKDLTGELVQHVVAYDAVCVVVSATCTDAAQLIADGLTEGDMRAVYYINGGAAASADPPDGNWNDGDEVGPIDVIAWAHSNDADLDDSVSWDELTVASTNANEITIYDRAEKSGTEEVFSEQIIDTSTGTLEAAGITATHETGNSALRAAIAGDADALSFMSYGYTASGSGLEIIPFQGDYDTAPVMPNEDSIMMGEKEDGAYDGARPLCYVTVNEPTGATKLFIDFCKGPEVNQIICEEADYLNVYG